MSKILVADDDEIMLGLLKTLMELEGNTVVTVTRPNDILPTVRNENPALILMDYHLAGGNSITALRELKSDEILKQIPILVTSGMDREYECLKAGAEVFLLKPFRPAKLIELVESYLEQEN
jgi:CheY-like chemotaxis protein